MGTKRLVRVNELLKREVASVLYRLINQEGFDMAAITITRVETATDLRHARVFVSIRDHEEDRGSMLRLLRQRARDIQQHLRKTVTLKYIPRITFEFDASVQRGDRVLQILDDLETNETPDEHTAPGE